MSAPRRFYFVRHGESMGNAGHYGGPLTVEEADGLTELGHAQARSVGKRLRGEGIGAIISSPMERARQTAEDLNRVLGLRVLVDPDIFEIRASSNFYQVPHTKRMELVPHLAMAAHEDDLDYHIGDAESFTQALRRVRRFKRKLERRRGSKPLLFVTHADFLRFFLGDTLFGKQFAPGHFNALWSMKATNTGITVFEFDTKPPTPGYPKRPWKLLTWMDHRHL